MRWWLVAMVAGAGLAALANGAPRAGIVSLSPTGSVAGPEQILVRFATPMVAMGTPGQAAPITASCAAGAVPRWVNDREFALDLPAPLAGGQRCAIATVPGLKDLAGQPLSPQRFAFDTGGPSLRAITPDYEQLSEDQIFLLALNAAPTPASAQAHAACLIEGVGERVPLEILPTATRDAILKGAGRSWQISSLKEAAGWEKPRYSDEGPAPRGAIVAARCKRTLPAGGKVSIVWGAGLATAGGLLAGSDTRRDFRVRPAFLARLECSRVNAAAACSPLEAVHLRFTGQVPRAAALGVRLVGSDGKALAPTAPEGKANTLDGVDFKGPFAAGARYRIVLPAGLKDDAGRSLANAARFPLPFTTGAFPPLAKFAGTFGIIEAAEGGVLPVTLRGVESPLPASATTLPARSLAVADDATIAKWLRALEKAEERSFATLGEGDARRSVETTRAAPLIKPGAPARRLAIPRDKDPKSFEVVGIPLKTRGFHVVEIASPALGATLLGPGQVRHVATGALVTDMAVHFQWGEAASLVWVTRLSDATPVAGARLAITNSCTGALVWQGRSDRQGRAAVPAGLPRPANYANCDYGDSPPLMVSARTADDMSFTLSGWGQGIQGWDFNIPQGFGWDPTAIHAIADRTLLRPGDAVNLKLLWRTRSAGGIAPGPALKNPALRIHHWPSGTMHDVPISVAGQSATARWAVPAGAVRGDYAIELKADGRDWAQAGTLAVEDFRLPAIRADVTGPKATPVAPTAVTVDLGLAYLSGGAVAGAPVKLRTSVQPRDVSVPGFDGWSFTGQPLKPGIEPLGADEEAPAAPLRARIEPVTLGSGGTARVAVPITERLTGPATLIAEMDYDDANGEVATKTARIPIEPAALRVGLKGDGWLAKADDLRLQFVVLDLAGKPVKGKRVAVKLYAQETYSYRKRLIGGFYAYDNSRETRLLDAGCTATSDAQGRAACSIDAGVSGEVVALAEVADDAGRIARASRSIWLAGDDDWWFGGDNGDRMDLVPESPTVAANGTARLQVRMPFREATALVTVLREGVLSSYVTTLSGKDPVIAVKMQGHYAPNVVVSVLAVRGRVAGWRLWLADLARRWNLPWISRDAAYPTALVDLAKPSYRLGMARLQVGWDAHKLNVAVAPDKASTGVRSPVLATVSVTPPKGRRLPADAEIAFAAVDEALLQLKPNESWDVLAAMMQERPLSVVHATAQSQVVGKRHYGRKAVAAGGGGGDLSGVVRRDFDPLLAWVGRVKLAPDGTARVRFNTGDGLSGYRLVAIATAGSDLFGTGAAALRTTQALQLLPGIPPVVREGDSYVATVLARNATDKPMMITAQASAGVAALPAISTSIPAGGARTLAWPVRAPAQGTIQWTVRASAGAASDALQVRQQILPAVPPQLLMATLLQGGGTTPLALPAGARSGSISIALSRSLGGTLPGVRSYMAAYPYDCIEQRLSVAVALGDRARWDASATGLAAWQDERGLLRFFPAAWLEGDAALSAHVLKLSAQSGWPLPAGARERLVAGLAAVVAGQGPRTATEPERVAALAALAAAGAATPAQLAAISPRLDAWPTATLIDWADAVAVLAPGRLPAAEAALRARLDAQGTTLSLARGLEGGQLLASPDATRAALLGHAVRHGWRAEAPRLARGLMLAQARGHWDTTAANALAVLALGDFGRAYEAAPVAGTTNLALGPASRAVTWGKGDPAAVSLPWPAGQTALNVRHTGSGQPWAQVTASTAVPITRPLLSGFAVTRSISAVSQARPGRWTRGDVMRVRITVTPRAPTRWMVINDPVPAGATILGGTLGGRSELLAGGESASGMPPSFVERRADAVHAHYEAVGRGAITHEYTLRLGTRGTLNLPPTRVEALYAPEMMALIPNRPIVVE